MNALVQIRKDALAKRVDGVELGAGSGWLGAARKDAAARLEAMGLPVKRDEYWRYTDPSRLTAKAAAEAAIAAGSDEADFFAALDRVKLVFVDGVFDAAASDALELAGVSLETLAAASATEGHWAGEVFGVLEARGQTPVERPLATFNTATAAEGLVIRVSAEAARPVQLIYRRSAAGADASVHHVVKVEEGASFTLLETGRGGARMSSVLEVEVADRAAFHHIRTQGADQEAAVVSHVFARIGEEGSFKSFTLTQNGRLTRNEAILELAGEGGSAHVAGAFLGEGAAAQQDDTIFITHAAPGCESRQVFKKVLRNGATGVFQGKILVKQIAQKTDGYQISQSLLLDEDAQFLCKPELEIYADDVKCSHGSTSGAIDDTALFYLQSRGVPKREAQSLLVLAFLAEAIDEIADEAIADDVRARLEDWLNVVQA